MRGNNSVYPPIWELGKSSCIEDQNSFNPSEAYDKKIVPLEVIKEWFALGTAKELTLFMYGKSGHLEFKCLGFSDDKKERWIPSAGDWLPISSRGEGIKFIKEIGLYDEYQKRFTDDSRVLW